MYTAAGSVNGVLIRDTLNENARVQFPRRALVFCNVQNDGIIGLSSINNIGKLPAGSENIIELPTSVPRPPQGPGVLN